MVNMNEFKTFLESSTVHGLVYISTTSKFVRLFWIVVVFLGFSFATYLNITSYYTWQTYPVSTTMETKPIDQVKGRFKIT